MQAVLGLIESGPLAVIHRLQSIHHQHYRISIAWVALLLATQSGCDSGQTSISPVSELQTGVAITGSTNNDVKELQVPRRLNPAVDEQVLVSLARLGGIQFSRTEAIQTSCSCVSASLVIQDGCHFVRLQFSGSNDPSPSEMLIDLRFMANGEVIGKSVVRAYFQERGGSYGASI